MHTLLQYRNLNKMNTNKLLLFFLQKTEDTDKRTLYCGCLIKGTRN